MLSAVDFGSGTLELARVGVASAVVSELIDAPPLLGERGTQTFIDATFAKLDALATGADVREHFADARRRLRDATAPFDRGGASRAYTAASSELLREIGTDRARKMVLGVASQQAVYNSRVLREAKADTELRTVIGAVDTVDALIPGLAADRLAFAALPAEDYTRAETLAVKLIDDLLGAPVTFFPAAPRIWTILVRERPVPGRDAPHASLDVVWFDGHHDVYAAVPDGGAFDRNADHQRCLRDREPATGTVHAAPIAPPALATYDALAMAIDRACTELTSHAPPYDAAKASDDRFVRAVLISTGIAHASR